MAYLYINRQGKEHYFKEVKTKNGKSRYSVTRSKNFSDLIDEIPQGYEVTELPEDARVVIRKIKKVLVTKEEQQKAFDIIQEESALTDFFIHAELDYLNVYHSQFNYIGGYDRNLTRAEAKECFGESIEKWIQFDTSFRLKLIDVEKRLFHAERVFHLSYFNDDFYPIGKVGTLESLLKEFGKHLGRESFYSIDPSDNTPLSFRQPYCLDYIIVEYILIFC